MAITKLVHTGPGLAALLCASAFALAMAPSAQSQTTIYVAPAGIDSATGSASAPLRTLGAALLRAKNGERIELAPGTYPKARDELTRAAEVQVVGSGTSRTTVQGLEIYGGQRLTFSGIRFTGAVALQGHPIRHAAQPASSVAIRASEIETATTCITIREGARAIVVADSHLHGCYVGIAGPGNPYVSRDIKIRRNTIEEIKADGIQFGGWSQVDLTDNLIRDIHDPAEYIHNDAVQLTGNSTDVTIQRNRLLDSRGQLLLIQDAIGPIDNVDVLNNHLSGSGAVALQSQGAMRSSFVNNTIWNARHGGLWLRMGYPRAGAEPVVPTDTVMSNNVATTIRVMEGAATPAAAGNVVTCPDPYSGITVPPGASCVTDPGFVNLTAGDLRLSSTSAARALGSSFALPPVDLRGATRTKPVPGAYN